MEGCRRVWVLNKGGWCLLPAVDGVDESNLYSDSDRIPVPGGATNLAAALSVRVIPSRARVEKAFAHGRGCPHRPSLHGRDTEPVA